MKWRVIEMSDLYNEIEMKKKMVSILNQAIESENNKEKIEIASRVFSEKGIAGIINYGIYNRVIGLEKEIEELSKLNNS